MVHPTFRVIVWIKKKKTAEQIVYLNNDQQMYNHEQQFSFYNWFHAQMYRILLQYGCELVVK